MKKKVLIVTSVASMVQQFNMNNIKLLKNQGYEVHVACNFVIGNTISDEKIDKLKSELASLEVKFFQIDFSRNIFNIKKNWLAFRQQKEILKNDYFFVHCQSPIAGVIVRLQNLNKERIIYTAHGFHFYKGAPLKNWLIFYPIEKLLSRKTNILITINKEDYRFAKLKFSQTNVEYVHGIGVDTDYFQSTDFQKKVVSDGDCFILTSIGELNPNKNHQKVIKDLSKIKELPFTYNICGVGEEREKLQKLIDDCGLDGRVNLLGFRDNIKEILDSTNIYIHPSRREGLPVSVMEAMAMGLPVLGSNIRGNNELIEHGHNGYLVDLDSENKDFSYYIRKIYNEPDLRAKMSEASLKKVEAYSLRNVIQEIENIYKLEASGIQ